MSYENDCRGAGDHNPTFAVVAVPASTTPYPSGHGYTFGGFIERRYVCRECGLSWPVLMLRDARVPHHKPRKPDPIQETAP